MPYRFQCMSASGTLPGQTSRTMHVCMQEHVAGLRKGNMSCPLTRHAAMHQPTANSLPDFKMKKFRKPRSIMERLVLENEMISQDDDNGIPIWNNKADYGLTALLDGSPA